MDFLSPTFRDDPWPTYAHHRRHQPVRWAEQIGMFLVFRYADIRHCLTDPVYTVRYPFRVSRQVLGETLLDIEGPDHRRLRKLLARALLGRTDNAGFVEAVEEIAARRLSELDPATPIDYREELARRVPLLTTAAFLGIPEEDCPFVRERLDYLMDHLDGSKGNFERASALRAELARYADEYLTGRRPAPPGSMLAQARVWVDEGDLNLTEAEGLVLLTLAAGVETSTGLFSNTMVCLSRFPEWRDRAAADLDLVPAVIREVLRWQPPQHDTVRFATEDTTLAGVEIPRGSPLKLLLASGNRDEDIFERPEEFDPARTETVSLSFGHGLHSCLGAQLAMRVAVTFHRELLTRYPEVRVADDPIPPISGGTFRMPERLTVQLAADRAVRGVSAGT